MNRRITPRHVAHIITLERDGTTTPEAVLADAKDKESPLHDLFDWNVKRAAEAHWLERSRDILRGVHYVIHTETHSYTLRAVRARSGRRPRRRKATHPSNACATNRAGRDEALTHRNSNGWRWR